MMLFGMVLTFVLMMSALGILAAWLGRRIVVHLKDNPVAVSALTEHLIVPILGKHPETTPETPEEEEPKEKPDRRAGSSD